MFKKTKTIIMLLSVYILIFWVGFKSGEIHHRMSNKRKVEKIAFPVPEQSKKKLYYIIEKVVIEKVNHDHYTTLELTEVGANDMVIQFFLNKKLRPLLKLRNLRIYTSRGTRIY